MLTSAGADECLALQDNRYVGWLTAITDWRAGTVTEASYTGYARAQISLGAAGATTPTGGRQRTNDATATGGQNSDVGTTNAIGWGIYSASVAGTLYEIGLLDADAPVFGTVTSASPGVVTAPAHGLDADQRVFVMAVPGAPLPTGFAENTAYYVGTVPDANSITLSTTAANANPVNTSSVGACVLNPYTPLAIAQNATPQFEIGALVLQRP